MELLYIVLAAVVLLVLYNWYTSRNIQTITTSELKDLLKNKSDYQFIDVRTPGEFKANKIKGFVNIPLDQLSSQSGKIAQDKKLVVICQSGARSSRAAKLLTKSGHNDVLNVRGGMSLWR